MSGRDMTDVAVIGGGISGLTLAWHLNRAGVDVRLLEANEQVGGCTQTERRDGFILEKGPFNVLVRDPSFEALLDGVPEEVKVISASRAARKRFIYRRGRLMTVPSNPIALATTPLLPFASRIRLVTGLLASRRAGDAEETIEQVAVRRFGRAVADTMISAVVSGIFAGNVRRLSLRACFPKAAAIDRKARSLMGYGLAQAFRSKKKGHPRRYRGLISIDGGLGAMMDALGRSLGSNLRTGYRVDRIDPSGDGYNIIPNASCEGTAPLECRRVVLAPPATEVARLLQPLIPEASTNVAAIESASLVVLNLGFRRADIGHPMEGYGFLVPHDETSFPLMGALWADSIFPHYANEDMRLMRVFIGGANNPQALEKSDDELLATALDSLRPLLQVTGDPVLVDCCRHTAAIPQYHVGHVERTERLQSAVDAQPNLHLAGNYLRGVSLNDCVRVSTELAVKLVDETQDSE